MEPTSIKTPGVYIDELNAFPNSVVPVATAVPAFVGYTPKAGFEGSSYLNQPVKISSWQEFVAYFCYLDTTPAASPKQYSPQYYLVKQKVQPVKGDYTLIDGSYFSILPDADTIYYLYNSVKLFYQNGGGDAYIVSVGSYGKPSGSPQGLGTPLVNNNVQLNELLDGIALLRNEQEPTMYICPEATLLSAENNSTLMQAMLLQCSSMGTAISIFDIINGNAPDPILYTNDIAAFRNSTGSIGLNYGTAYYPFVGTTLMQPGDIDYTNLFGGDVKQLLPLLNPADNPDPTVEAIIHNILYPSGTPVSTQQNNSALLIASKTYSNLMNQITAIANIMPASGGMAGVISTVDNQTGPWQSPANISIVGVSSLPIRLSEDQQANLNVDALSGKSINAIRFFNGLGILVWGARTLDGNSQDWRYLSVRRTMIFLEQSCKLAARAYIFQPNDKNTWSAVTSMINSFLTSVWKEGGLQGSTPSDAFSVSCGLGVTMTAEDILNGFMTVTVKVSIVRPAEFIVFTFQQEMASSN